MLYYQDLFVFQSVMSHKTRWTEASTGEAVQILMWW